MKRKIAVLCAVGCTALLAGCAGTSPQDPLEPVNRATYSFNDGVDRIILKPVASGYKAITPDFARQHVSNVFNNAGDVWGTVNAGLQLKPEKFFIGVFRLGVNTVFGLGGLLDIASEMGLDSPQEDFSQTLGYWGINPGPYIVWPLLGPSTVRDSIGMVADAYGDPVSYIQDDGTRYGVSVLYGINTRAQLIGADNVLEDAALDKYLFVRDGYLQRRQNLVYDGNPPMDAAFEIDDEDL